MNILTGKKDKLTTLFICCLWAFVILFFVSPDSYTHDMFYRWDSAWFFTCGKAWVEGLRPYVDFADSKGPVLWLIHAVAYVLSPYNYLGLFWLSVLLYGVIFYIDYKIADLFLKDARLSWLVVLFLPWVYFNPWYHFEISAEDWCQPVVSLVMYRMVKLLYVKENSRKELCVTGFILGFALMWTLLIKFSLTVMLGVSECYCLYYLIRERTNIVKPLLFFSLGVLSLAAPILAYMLYTGILEAFVAEYFVHTLQTVSSDNPLGDYIHEWFRTFADAYYMVLFSLCVIGCYLLGRKMGKDKYFLMIAFLGFYGLAIHHNIHRHYVNCCLFFLLPFLIYMIQAYQEELLSAYQRTKRLAVVVVLFLTILVNWTYTEGFIVPNLFFVNQQDRTDYYTVGYYMSQVQRPTLLYYRFAERGYGTLAGALPASKYWSTQTDPTQEMLDVQHRDAMTGKADFIITYLTPENDKLFTEIGYRKVYEFTGLALYSKHKLKIPSEPIRVSNLDVLLKRKPF